MGGLVAGLAGGQGNQPQIMQAIWALVEQQGGIQALLSKLSQSGLADQVASWVGAGENQTVNPAQLLSALGGTEKLAPLAQQFGLSTNDLTTGIAGMLPQVVNQVTPQGQIPTNVQDLLGAAMKMFG